MQKYNNLAIVGSTGLVGRELFRLIKQGPLPFSSLRCFASGQNLTEEQETEILKESSFKGIDLAFFCLNSELTKKFVPLARKEKTLVIDLSSTFRMESDVPLIIPEINPEAIATHKGIIASPNCVTTLMLLPLAPLHAEFGLKRIIASTYQAASGGGKALLAQLKEESQAFLKDENLKTEYGFNLFLHDSPIGPDLYSEEEVKMLKESHKILGDSSFKVSATCVRVPVMRAHSIAINAEFKKSICLIKAASLIKKAKGVSFLENAFPTPMMAMGKDDIFVGRLRQDCSHDKAIEMWIVGDQLLKGAALNAYQIAQMLLKK